MIAHPYIGQRVRGVRPRGPRGGRAYTGTVTDVYPNGKDEPHMVIVLADETDPPGLGHRTVATDNQSITALENFPARPFKASPETTLREMEEAALLEDWRLINIRPAYLRAGWVCAVECRGAPVRGEGSGPSSWDALNDALDLLRAAC